MRRACHIASLVTLWMWLDMPSFGVKSFNTHVQGLHVGICQCGGHQYYRMGTVWYLYGWSGLGREADLSSPSVFEISPLLCAFVAWCLRPGTLLFAVGIFCHHFSAPLLFGFDYCRALSDRTAGHNLRICSHYHVLIDIRVSCTAILFQLYFLWVLWYC
jgi:hypothetical protein